MGEKAEYKKSRETVPLRQREPFAPGKIQAVYIMTVKRGRGGEKRWEIGIGRALLAGKRDGFPTPPLKRNCAACHAGRSTSVLHCGTVVYSRLSLYI